MCSSVLVHGDPLGDRLAVARALLDSGKKSEARVKYEALKGDLVKILADKPEDAHASYLFGCVCMDGGDDEKAAEALDRAIKAEPKNAQYLSTRALLCEYLEQPNEAAVFYQKVVELAPGNGTSWINLARTQAQCDKPEEAIKSLRKAVAIDPKNPDSLELLGSHLLKARQFDEARKLLTQVVVMKPRSGDVLFDIGQLEQLAGNNAAALAAYEKGLKISPDDDHAWAKMVQLHQALGHVKERDAARDKVFTLWKAGDEKNEKYCREQFQHGNSKVMVFEYFELTGDRPVRYAFHLLGKDGKSNAHISLGSYESTTEAARAVGEIKNNERIFHLDSYQTNRHSTLGMFDSEPDYEKTRQMVVDFLDGKLKPLSSSAISE